jgi:hypothetical protein
VASERNTQRYETAIATFVGFLALVISAYTAYEQHLQVRAQVWPILEITMGNSPIAIHAANKGVGPAIVRDVIVRIDGRPARDWDDILEKVLGPGDHNVYYNSLNCRIVAAGETFDMLRLHDEGGNDARVGKGQSVANKFWDARTRAQIEVCYCSTLDECWQLVAKATEAPVTTPVRRCPPPSAASFHD